MLRTIKHFFLKIFSGKYRQYLIIQEEIQSRFGQEVASKMKFDKKGFAIVPDANGHLKKEYEKQLREEKQVIPRAELLCKHCGLSMMVSIGQNAEVHGHCRKEYRRNKRLKHS